jgi:endonuclease/exonuclease/phosphatase family metal-dependent hydrolase
LVAGPLVLGGDFNLREPAWPGLAHIGGQDVDHLFVTAGLQATGTVVLDRGPLSDHAPLAVTVQRSG